MVRLLNSLTDVDRLAKECLLRREVAVWRKVDETTKAWCRNANDIRAAVAGHRFQVVHDEWEGGAFPVWWIERYCRLYEGEFAGHPLRLRGQHGVSLDWPIHDRWDSEQAKDFAVARAERYAEDYWDGVPVDWQYEVIMRLFGWRKFSERYARWIRRFTEASIWVPKKNKKSPTLAALGLYILIGEGEPGQKVFVAAKDGGQARGIVGQHALEMIRQSPELDEECVINLQKMQITYTPTRSILLPLSSGSKSHQKAKEGLNGSLLVDEVHVVDREYMERIGRAGISRAEPLKVEVSTAGDDPDCYGKERYDYGQRVQAGTVRDLALLFVDYSIPQDLSPDDFANDPIGYGQRANPAWGHTIDPEEFLTDYDRSKLSIRTMISFLMYRCNKWARTASPWLRISDWERGHTGRELSEWDGCSCVLSLDKSKTQDMTSIVATFWEASDRHDWQWVEEIGTNVCAFCGAQAYADEEAPETGCPDSIDLYQYPFFWLPEATAKARAKDADFLGWAARGELNLIPGEVIQDGYLKATLRWLCERFQVEGIYYDRTYCEDITQWCEEELGIDRIEFPQNSGTMSEPIVTFERRVLQAMILHPRHSVLDWQAGHVTVKEYPNGRRILVKPTGDDVKKIDGMVASVMGSAAALEAIKNDPSLLGGDSISGMWD
jgi:phage terminase large subunit-like protein